jgi:hypothetical protein
VPGRGLQDLACRVGGAYRIAGPHLQRADVEKAPGIEISQPGHLGQGLPGRPLLAGLDLRLGQRGQRGAISRMPRARRLGDVERRGARPRHRVETDQRKAKIERFGTFGDRLLEPALRLGEVARTLLEQRGLVHGHRIAPVLAQHLGVGRACGIEAALRDIHAGQVQACGGEARVAPQGLLEFEPGAGKIARGLPHAAEEVERHGIACERPARALGDSDRLLGLATARQQVRQRTGDHQILGRALETRRKVGHPARLVAPAQPAEAESRERSARALAGGLLEQLARTHIAPPGKLDPAQQEKRLRIVWREAKHVLEQFGRARGIAELVQHRGQQAATAEVVRVARDQRLEVAARLLVLASGVMGEPADHQQLLATREPFRRQRVDQRRRVGKQARGTRRIPLALGEQGEQVVSPRLRRPLLETLQHRARLRRTAEIDEDPCTRDRSVEQPRIELLGAAVVGQRGIELASRVRTEARAL